MSFKGHQPSQHAIAPAVPVGDARCCFWAPVLRGETSGSWCSLKGAGSDPKVELGDTTVDKRDTEEG